MIPFARLRVLDPLFDGLWQGKAWAIATLVVIVLLFVGIGQYNRWRRKPDEDSPRTPFWLDLAWILPYFVAAGLLFAAFKIENVSLGASAFIVLSVADLVRGDGDVWWSRWRKFEETTVRIISGVTIAIAGLVLLVAIAS